MNGPRRFAAFATLSVLLACSLWSWPSLADAAEHKQVQRLPNGLRLAYIELGPPSALTLLFLHGYTNSSRGYLPIGHLLARDHHVLLVDLRGHGGSDKPECCYSRIDFAWDLKLLLDRLHIDKADVVGHSLGSIVGQTFAEYWPDRTRRLVLIASLAGVHSSDEPGAPPPPPLLGVYDAPVRALKDPIDPDSDFMKAWWTVPNVDADTQRAMRRESAAIPADIWRAMLDQGQTSIDLRATLDRIQAPTLLLFGGQDALFDAHKRDALIAALPKAKVKIFEALGHSLPEQDPPAVAEAIRTFLGGTAP